MIYVISYPRSGTTLLQNLVCQLKGAKFKNLMDVSPIVQSELIAPSAEKAVCLKTHRKLKTAPEHKYLYIARNPLDCFVSCFHMLGNGKPLDAYLTEWLRGHPVAGKWSDHVAYGKKEAAQSNVLWLTYEGLLNDWDATVLKIAAFIDVTTFDQAAVKQACSFETMKADEGKFGYRKDFIRAGKIDGWKTFLSEAQAKRITDVFHWPVS